VTDIQPDRLPAAEPPLRHAAYAWQTRWRPGELATARFVPMGLHLELVTNSPLLLAAARDCFGGYGEPAPDRPVDLTLRLYQHSVDAPAGDGGATAAASGHLATATAAAAEAADGSRDARFFDGGAAGAPLSAPILRCEGPYLYQASGPDTVMVVDRGAGITFGYLAAATVADAAHLTWHYLWPAVSYHLECRGFAGVHAAAIARHGCGLLLRGRSGQGKTTLTYAATRRGWQAVSEDIVWVDARGATWWGSPWTFHLLPDARQLFSELSGHGVALQPNGEIKVVVDMESLWPGSTLPKAAAGPVVILERRHGGTSSLVTLDPTAAHHEWLDGCARHERQAPGYDQTVADLLSRGCHRLHLGDDLDAALDLLEPLLP
jgi:hypothetical protein